MRACLWLCVVSFLLAAVGCGQSTPRVVLYCAQDREFAEQVLEEFTRQTGLEVAPKFDTEAQKSVSLYVELVQERARPRCDVFWNNEILSTIRLQRQGLLEPYTSSSADPFPARTKAKDSTWQAFAERARIIVINTDLVRPDERPRSLLDLTDACWRGKAAIAKPGFGTTATEAACLFATLGSEKAKAYYRDLHKNGVHIVSGNKQVAEGVGQGQFAVGVTDTDDAVAEIDAGRPVAIIFPGGTEGMGTLFIPNTLAILRGCPNPDRARKLVDYLLSADVEGKLAQSASRQIPLNPNVHVALPPALEGARTAERMAVDFEKAADFWDETQRFLHTEFGGP
jgi:iron(III) transport system substrate-binding protein